MEKFNFQPVFETMQGCVNVVLSEHAKALIEMNDYQTLAKIAEIGELTTSFFEGLATTIHFDAESISTTDIPEKVVQAEVTEDSAVKLASDVTTNNPKTKKKFSVSNIESKTWIFNYLGKRGGRAKIKDTYLDFWKEFHYKFTEDELKNKEWESHVSRRVCEMRETKDSKGQKVQPLIEPTHGKRSDYYALSEYGMRSYKIKADEAIAKQYRQTTLDEMTG